MPGIYIDPASGSQITSTLGNILGGMATNMDPKTIAEAQKLKYDTESVDIANQKAAEEWRSRVNAANNAVNLPGVGSVPSAVPGDGSVAGTVAAAAVPPPALIGGLRHPAQAVLSTNPYASQVQDWTLSGAATPDAMKNSIIPLGQTLTTGPGTDITTQTEIAKQKAASDIAIAQAKSVPYNTVPGETHHVPGGALSETITSGGDPGTAEAQKTEQSNAVADATLRRSLAFKAPDIQGVLDTVKQLHDTVAATTPGAVIGDNIRTWLAAHGANVGLLSTREGALIAINQLLKSTVGDSLTAARADPNSPVRGELQNANDLAPDPSKMDDEAFNVLLKRMYKVTDQQQEEGGPARLFLNTAPTPDNVRAYNNQLEALRAARAKANADARNSGGGAGGGGQTYIVPDEATALKLPPGTHVQIGVNGPHFVVGQ